MMCLCTVIGFICTDVLVENQSIVKDPRLDGHEIGDKGRNLALDNRRIALDHVFVLGLRYIKLGYDCNP